MRRFIPPEVYLYIGVLVFVLAQPALSSGQTQYWKICKQQFDEALPGSSDRLQAALKLTDALYYYDLKAALNQAKQANQFAMERNDRQAQAVCEIDLALITGWLVGHDEALKHYDRAMDLFEETAQPEYRIHFYSSVILYEIFRNRGEADFSEYFRLNDVASRECSDPYLELHQNMLSAFNRVVLGECSLDAPEIQYSRKRIETLNHQLGLYDASAILAILDAWQVAKGSPEYSEKVKQGLEFSRQSGNRLYQVFALSLQLAEKVPDEDWQSACSILEECLAICEAHNAPPIIFDFLAKTAAVKLKLDEFDDAKQLIDRAMEFKYFNSRTQADRHELYQLAFDLYCAEGDTENIKKYAKLMSDPEHIRAVVETEQHNQQLRQEIAKLKQNNRTARREYRISNSNLQSHFRAAHEDSRRKIRALSMSVAILSFLGLGAALYINRNHLLRVQKRLSEEQESSRRGNEIRSGLELKLNRLQRMESLGLMAGGVAHDFNNLLVGVLGNAEILKMRPDSGDEFFNQRIEQIISSADKAADLSRQMLAYAGKQQIEHKTVDLNGLVSAIEPVLRSNLQDNMSLSIELWELPLVCEIDETQIEQVVMNLVSNAVSASKSCGKILIRTGQEKIKTIDEDLHGIRTEGGLFNFVEVKDFGIGIAEAEMERIFEPFYSDKSAGRGLGLAVVYGMVNGHDGLIRSHSSIGQGATFRILLPAALSKAAGDRNEPRYGIGPEISASDQAVRPTILVVDDEVAVLDLVQQSLTLKGWHVLIATSGTQALSQIEEHKDKIGVILLDVVMDGMGGPEVLRDLNDRQISLPIVLMSGFSQTQLSEYQSESQVVSVLQKPFRLHELFRAVEQASNFSAFRPKRVLSKS